MRRMYSSYPGRRFIVCSSSATGTLAAPAASPTHVTARGQRPHPATEKQSSATPSSPLFAESSSSVVQSSATPMSSPACSAAIGSSVPAAHAPVETAKPAPSRYRLGSPIATSSAMSLASIPSPRPVSLMPSFTIVRQNGHEVATVPLPPSVLAASSTRL